MLAFLLALALQSQVVVARIAVTVPVDPPVQARAQPKISIFRKRSVYLFWRGSDDLALPTKPGTGYTVYRANGIGDFSALTPSLLRGWVYQDTAVVRGVSYRYYVTAKIGKVESKPSNVVSATVK
jgi:hypothetical protein